MATLWFLIPYVALVAAVAAVRRWIGRPLRREDLAVFAALPLIFVSPGIPGNQTPVPTDHLAAYCVPWKSDGSPPYNATLSDFASQFAPWAKAVRLAWKERSFPWWDRWNGCGTPLAANGQASAFSPFTFAMFLLPLARAFLFLGAAKLFLAMTGMHLWISELGVSRHASRFGAVLFGLSFVLAPWLYHPATAGLAVWPWILFAVEYGDESRKAWRMLVALLTIWPLCGHLETVALGTLFVVLWLGLRSIANDVPEPGKRAARLASAGLVALGLSSFLLIPQAHAILASNRLALARDPRHLSYVPWVPYHPGWLGALLTSIFPRAYGDAIATPMYPGAAGSLVEMGFGYIGLVGWACAFSVRGRSPRAAKQNALEVLALFGLGAAMGLQPFRAIVELLPLGLAPPLRFLLFVGLSGCVLAALGLEQLFQSESDARRAARGLLVRLAAVVAVGIVWFVENRKVYQSEGASAAEKRVLISNLAVAILAGVVAAAFALRWIRSPTVAVAALTVVAAGQLLFEGMRLYRFYPMASFYPQTPLTEFLRTRRGLYRVVGEQTALFPNTNVFPGLEDIRTHDPMERRDYVEFLSRACGYPPSDYAKRIVDLNSPGLDFLNVRYLIAGPGRVRPGAKWRVAYAGGDGTVFENADVMPRFFAPAQAAIVDPANGFRPGRGISHHALAAFGPRLDDFLAARRFRDRALLLGDEAGAFRTGVIRQREGALRVSAMRETTNRIVFDATVEGGSAIVVGSVTQDGGWTARDETGSRLPTTLADGPFLALLVPGGKHRISLEYRPPGLWVGAAIASATALVLVALSVRRRRGRVAGSP